MTTLREDLGLGTYSRVKAEAAGVIRPRTEEEGRILEDSIGVIREALSTPAELAALEEVERALYE